MNSKQPIGGQAVIEGIMIRGSVRGILQPLSENLQAK